MKATVRLIDRIAGLPVLRIDFTTLAGERAALVGEAIAEAAEWIEAAENGPAGSAPGKRGILFSAFSDSSLGHWLDGQLAAEPEQSDVVHGRLAHLAERVIAMHKEK